MCNILNNFNERLRAEVERIGVSELARRIGGTRNTLYNWCEKGNIPLDKLMLLGQHGVDVQYIVLGLVDSAQNIEQKNETLFDGMFSLIPVYDVQVSAGHGAFAHGVTEASSALAFRNDWLAARGLKKEHLLVMQGRGDSMYPTINDGEYMLINSAAKDPMDGHIYVIRSGDMIWVKRVQRNLDSSLLLISDNKAYPPMPLVLDTAADVEVVGKLVNSSRNFY